jgi:hypothetical protein
LAHSQQAGPLDRCFPDDRTAHFRHRFWLGLFIKTNWKRSPPSGIIRLRRPWSGKRRVELIFDLTSAYATALLVAVVVVAALGVWWITRKALQPLLEVAVAAEQIDAKALSHRLPVGKVSGRCTEYKRA